MSHFNVAVFTRTGSVEEVTSLLEPFDECVGRGSPYAEFQEDEDGDLDEATGKHGYWHNPDARHDCWVSGGRWRGLLHLKEGRASDSSDPDDPTRCDSAKVRDCDFTPDEEAGVRAARFWEVVVEGKPLREGEDQEDFKPFYNKLYFLEKYGTKEAYQKSCSRFTTHAFLTCEGEWSEAGRMGWFGLDDSTVESRGKYEAELEEYLKEAETEDLYITIVDCHI